MEERAAASNASLPDPNHGHSGLSRSGTPSAGFASPQTPLESSLRFPTPEGSNLLANWVTSSSTNTADTMSIPAFDETGSLADSAYELISSTDGESQDGRGTDSLAASIAGSFDLYARVDDVHSLRGREETYDDDEYDDREEADDEEDADSCERSGHTTRNGGRRGTQTYNTPNQCQLYNTAHGDDHDDSEVRRASQADSIRYAEQALCNPSTQSLSTLEYDSSHGDIGGNHSQLSHSIEFEELIDVGTHLDKVSVKHTIREFTEAETVILAANMGMGTDAPKKLAATICQTMSHHCLSNREPLRVLYIGSDAAYNDIMYKISSALLASAPPSASASRGSERRCSSTPSVYNIMPISSFGSTKVPEIDEIQLMGVSDYYIKVERCVAAEETRQEVEGISDAAVYSIELDNGHVHTSLLGPSGSVLRPKWALPHVAVFYVSGNDDYEMESMRDIAWEFMTRHAVPSVFISHAQSFFRSSSSGRWQDFVDQSAVHLCLESRDPSKPMAPERLPIDLASFLNIDARQMNRNLAYLTGIHDTPEKRGIKTSRSASTVSIEGVFLGVLQSVRLIQQRRDPRPQILQTVLECLALLRLHIWRVIATALFTVLMSSSLLLYVAPLFGLGLPSSHVASSPSSGWTLSTGCTPAAALTKCRPPLSSTTLPSVCTIPAVVPTVTISFVTTKTVEVPVSPSSSATSQLTFGGFLTDIPHSQKRAKSVSDKEIKSTGCSIQVYSSHEIFVKVHSVTKTQWLAKGAIDIDVWKGQRVLKSRLSTVDEGLIIEIDKKDAFGVMNVSVVTTVRPKINETFAVDFGKPTARRILETAMDLVQDSVLSVSDACLESASQAKEAIVAYANEHYAMPQSAETIASNLRKLVAEYYEKLQPADSVKKTLEEAQSVVKSMMPDMNPGHYSVPLSVRRAQVASKLWWLRMRGDMKEYERYKAIAAFFFGTATLNDQETPSRSYRLDTKRNILHADDGDIPVEIGLVGWR